jgi:hypothetical protein
MGLQNRLTVRLSDNDLNLLAEDFTVSAGSVSGAVTNHGDGRYSVDYTPDEPGEITVGVAKSGKTIVPPQRVVVVKTELSCNVSIDDPLIPTKIIVTLSESVTLGTQNFIVYDPEQTGLMIDSASAVTEYEYELDVSGVVKGGQIQLEIVKDGYVFDGSPADIYIFGEVSLQMAYVDNNDPRLINLQFSGEVNATNSIGISLAGIIDTLTYAGKKSSNTLQFKLGSKVVKPSDNLAVSYNGTGSITNPNGADIDLFSDIGVTNTSTWAAPGITAAQIPSGYSNHLVLTGNKALKVVNISGISISGTPAVIVSKQSQGNTIDLNLSENVDAGESITVSVVDGAITDNFDQLMAEIASFPVVNNSDHVAITVSNASVSNTDSNHLIIMMEGAVTKTDELGTGFSYIIDGGDPISLALHGLMISDGTLLIACDTIYEGQLISIFYDGTGGLKDVSGETIVPFSVDSGEFINNSAERLGVPSHVNASNLGILVLGHEPASSAEVTQVLESVSNSVRRGHIADLQVGDYMHLAALTVTAGNDAGGACSITSFPTSQTTEDPDLLKLVLVSKNPYKNVNGNLADHVVFQWENNPVTHYVNPTNTNEGGYEASKIRAYLLNQFRAGAKAAGIPFDHENNIIVPLHRAVAVSYSESTLTLFDPGAASSPLAGGDDIFLPTEFEIFGTHGPWYTSTPWCNRNAEVGQGATPPGTHNEVNQVDFEYYREYYNTNDPALGWWRWKKYGIPGSGGGTNWEDNYWLAGPSRGASTRFCFADVVAADAGADYADGVFGVSPAFAVA